MLKTLFRLAPLFCSSLMFPQGVAVLTQHYDHYRTGTNSHEHVLNPDNVRTRFHKLWTLPADGQIMAQPLYIPHLKSSKCPSTCDVVIFATMNNSIYAYDANRPSSKSRRSLLWKRNLGPPKPSDKHIDGWSTNAPVWGVVSTPVIDEAAQTLFAVAWTNEKHGTYRLHALNTSDGKDRVLPAPAIFGGVTVVGPTGGKVLYSLDPTVQRQRAALLLVGGVLYLGFSTAHENAETNNGFVFAYDARTLRQLAIWCSTVRGYNGGIWQSGQGIAADQSGDLYLATGNGLNDGYKNGASFGDSVVKLHLRETDKGYEFEVKDFFTPCDQAWLNRCDKDLGSTGPVILGETGLVASAGKAGILYLLSRDHLGKQDPRAINTIAGDAKCTPDGRPACLNGNVVQEVRVTNDHVHGSPVFWNGGNSDWLYVWGEHDRLRAYPVRNGGLVDGEVKLGDFQPPVGMPGAALAVSSDGKKPGTGIVWALVPLNGDAYRFRGVIGMLMAFNAEDVSVELWRSENSEPMDRVGLLARFVAPLVVDGKVFVATLGDTEPLRSFGEDDTPRSFPKHYYLAVYGLMPPSPISTGKKGVEPERRR